MTRPLSSPSAHLLVCVFLSLLWVDGGLGTTTTPPNINTSTVKNLTGGSTSSAPPTTTVTTTFTTQPRPADVANVTVTTQNESSITLTWSKVGNSTYTLRYHENGSAVETPVPGPPAEELVEYVVSPLTAATMYNFTLITRLGSRNSSGYNFLAFTAPRNVREIKTAGQNETSVTLQWEKVENVKKYILAYGDAEIHVDETLEEGDVNHTVASLSSATKYDFALFAVVEDIRSSGVNHTAVTAPRNAEGLKTAEQNETSVTLQWEKVKRVTSYFLVWGEQNVTVNASAGEGQVTVADLDSGVQYDFTLFAVFENVSSSGANLNSSTVPPAVPYVNVTERTADRVTLRWERASPGWTYKLLVGGVPVGTAPDASRGVVSHTLESLQAGTEYNFSVVTRFSELDSTAYEGFAVTAIDCAGVPWRVTNSSIGGEVEGRFSNATAASANRTHVSHGGNDVSFQDLCPGETYEVRLTYEWRSVRFEQCRLNLTLIPPTLSARCEYAQAGYAVSVVWNKPAGVWTHVQVNVSGQSHLIPEGDGEGRAEIPGLLPARTYLVTVASLSAGKTSCPFEFHCSTDPTSVIAGTVLGLLFFFILVFVVVFLLFKRPDLIRNRAIHGSKLYGKSYKPISAAQFPSHCCLLNADDKRGYVEEYESLLLVGTEQKQTVSLLPGNKAKNRFCNILPYNWCRVKLTASKTDGCSDYINASYIPGYYSDREYIATQGPLPSTVGDFWRMIWEKKVKSIVMVANCVELGRTKCEMYWPGDQKPILHGKLLVTTMSERQEAYWTLREFSVRHTNTTDVRTVKHFHFTAWPDHGVPESTAALIEFRRLMRQMGGKEAGAPTVVHCSAGVGRTGTTIALDVLLQQLEHEGALSVKAFVHKMRLSRPHMVQTESQYAFLHQCIVDCLTPEDAADECIYENADAIYANAIVLQKLQESNTSNSSQRCGL